jgi:hypothetical protein
MTNDTVTANPAEARSEVTDVTDLVDAYVASWNESDAAVRTRLVEQAWAEQGRYLDPLLDLTGHEALATLAPVLEQHYPGHRIGRTGDVDQHHNVFRFTWELTGPDGAVVIAGVDVGVLADDGRISAIAGFFDQ